VSSDSAVKDLCQSHIADNPAIAANSTSTTEGKLRRNEKTATGARTVLMKTAF
jgi:hypothetical protein